jgi:hypothetical protein
MEPIYVVLYTHQKTKKRKTWQDGELRIKDGHYGGLFDDGGQKIDR